MFRVIVCGSNKLRDGSPVYRALGELLAEHGELTVVHRGCRTGAERYAELWGSGRSGVTIERYAATWQGGRTGAAPVSMPTLTRQMIAAGADLVLAFYELDEPNLDVRRVVVPAIRAGLKVEEHIPRRINAAPGSAVEVKR